MRSKLNAVERAIDRVLAEVQEDQRGIEEDIACLVAARKALEHAPRSSRGRVNPRRAAGPAAIKSVSDVLEKVGRTTQAEIAKAAGLHSGSASHALAVLEADGFAVRTGRRHRNSPEWAWRVHEQVKQPSRRSRDGASADGVAA